MKNHIRLVLFLFLCACANVVAPVGGTKDVRPPELITAIPNNKSTNFNTTTITLIFNEYIQIKNKENIRISPLCEPPPKINVKGKKLELEIFCPLDSTITYTINFGKSILDINEGNVLENFKYVFSKGSQLDSLIIRGGAQELYSGNPASGALIGLYKNFNNLDSLLPYYYTFTNLDGSFTIENIKQSKYTILAILDQNNNFKYTQGELISMPELISDFDINKNLGLFQEKLTYPIIGARNTAKNLIRFQHKTLKDSIQILNTIGLWNRNDEFSDFWFKDSIPLIAYKFKELIDSVTVYNAETLNMELNPIIDLNQINIQKIITIKSNKPIKEIVSNKFIYPTKNDSLKAYLENAFTINVPFSPTLGEMNRLIVLEKAIIGIDNTYNDSINFNIDFNPTHYSVLNIKSVSSNQNRRIELFNTTDIVHHEQLIDSILVKWINPGNYRLRVFRDNNKNGVWDPGQINLNIPAEPIRVYPEIIKLRANWETEFLIDF